MNIRELYNAKKRSPEEAIELVKSGDKIYTGGNSVILHKALFDARERLTGVRVYSQFGAAGPSGKYLLGPEMTGHVSFACTTLSLSGSRGPWPNENLDQVSISFSDLDRIIEEVIKPDVVLLCGRPMDEYGYINLGSRHGCPRAAVDTGAKVLVQIDDNIVNSNTDYWRVHISEVDALCEAENPKDDGSGGGGPIRTVGETDGQIAAHITGRIPDGATIQLGAGNVSNALGAFLKDHKNLGVHAETIMASLVDLMKLGVINNSRKALLPGVSVSGFVTGGPEVHQYFHNNPTLLLKKISWVNSPAVISLIPNMVSVNSCLGVDLRGQVCSESIAMSNTGGIGGQLDFVEGARKAPGGQSFLAMHSSVKMKNGETISKITLTLAPGSVVTTPASDVMNVVTEFGVAELWGKTVRERARNLIGIAHPEFREKLTYDAKKFGLF